MMKAAGTARNGQIKMAAEFVYGMAAGSAVHVALQPLDTLKTRIIDSPVKPGERFALG